MQERYGTHQRLLSRRRQKLKCALERLDLYGIYTKVRQPTFVNLGATIKPQFSFYLVDLI
jgi:hypothetical protein